MNSYCLKDITIDTTETFVQTITEEKMKMFHEISGDNSPIHIDGDYAQNRGYQGKVCYGMLVASFFSTLAGVYLPGEHCLLHSVDTKFSKPVFIGDILTITGKVSEINEVFSQITIKATITNQNGKKVCTGVIKAGVAK